MDHRGGGGAYLLRLDRAQLDAARFQDGLAAGRAALDAGRAAEAAGMLRQSLSLWRGPVLADLAEYGFTRPEAARLEELRLAAVEARVEADLALGRHAALTAELEQLAAEHPLREQVHGQLMLALYRCGRQADSLAAYRLPQHPPAAVHQTQGPAGRQLRPYTTGAGDGAWHGPDMEKARRLVTESSTMNMPVTVWSQDDRLGKAAGSYLVGLLHDLGYRPRLHAVSPDQFFTDIYNPRLKIQVSIMAGWGADYPAPSTFFGPLLSCYSADKPGTQNSAGFCDPHVDALASQAQAAQLTDPAAARTLWAMADRIVTDQAPYVPIYNRSQPGFVSARVGNFQIPPVYGPLVDQMWVR